VGVRCRVATPDCLSITVEFDDGLDLSCIWSAAISAGTVFPPPALVDQARDVSGHAPDRTEPGRRLDQERPVLAGRLPAIGATIPARITGVWLPRSSRFSTHAAGMNARRSAATVPV
jgi:hypothetical protein